jgi:ankyrin repeat protein
MIQPEALKKTDRLEWSTGAGTDVWEMFQAAIHGDTVKLHILLTKDPSLVRGHWNYRKPMYFAVRENQLEAAKLLLAYGADPVNAWGEDTLLDIARDRGYAEMLKLLEDELARTRNFSEQADDLSAAIRDRDIAKVRTLLDASPGLLEAEDLQGNRAIHWATMTRNIPMIDEFLNRGADINAKRRDGGRPVQLTNGDYHYRGWRDVPPDVKTTPVEVLAHLRSRGAYVDICTAAHSGDIDRVRELLDEDPSLANRVGDYATYYPSSGSPLRNAATRGHMEIVKLLLERGADPNLREEEIAPKGYALYSAVYNGHYEIAKLLLERGAFPNPPVESSADALSIALMNDDQKMADLLCSYGASRSIDILSHYGDVRTAAAVFDTNPALANNVDALNNAAGNGHEGFVRLMLRHQPDLGKRARGPAKTRELTEFLFAQGMNPSQPSWMGVTPLHEFTRKGDIENAALFLDHGADIHARDEELCSTPLAWAAKFGRLHMVEFLLRRGAKLILRDDPPWATPLAWAARRQHPEIVALLKQYEATGTLPAPSIEPYEALSQDLVAAYTSGDVSALQRLHDYYRPQRKLNWDAVRAIARDKLKKPPAEKGADTLTLDEAQALVARSHGFENWTALAESVHQT